MELEKKKVLVVGLGNIGRALARVTILRKLMEVSVWNRSVDKAKNLFSEEEIKEEGVTFSIKENLHDAVKEAEIIVISLTNYDAAYSALQQEVSDDFTNLSPIVEELKGKLVIQLSSSKPSESRQWKNLMEKAGAINIDGCVIGWPSMAGSDNFSVLVSGCSEEEYTKYRPILRVWGKPTFAGTGAGQADALDMAVLTYLQGIKFGFMQGLALCKQAGVSIEQYNDFAKHYLDVYKSVLDDTADKVSKRDYTTHINTTVNILYEFNRSVLQHAEETGQSTEFLKAIDAPLHALVEAKKGQIDQTASFEYMLKPNSSFFSQ